MLEGPWSSTMRSLSFVSEITTGPSVWREWVVNGKTTGFVKAHKSVRAGRIFVLPPTLLVADSGLTSMVRWLRSGLAYIHDHEVIHGGPKGIRPRILVPCFYLLTCFGSQDQHLVNQNGDAYLLGFALITIVSDPINPNVSGPFVKRGTTGYVCPSSESTRTGSVSRRREIRVSMRWG